MFEIERGMRGERCLEKIEGKARENRGENIFKNILVIKIRMITFAAPKGGRVTAIVIWK